MLGFSEMSTLLSLASSIIVDPVRDCIQSAIRYLFTPRSTQLTIIIDERCGFTSNEVYKAACIYLGTKIGPDTKRFKVHKTEREKKLNTSIEKNEEIADTFQNVQLKWTFVFVESQKGPEKTLFKLTFHKKFKEKVLNEYLPFVLDKYKEIEDNEKLIKLYATNMSDKVGGSGFGSINFEHPSTFQTLAMDEEMKAAIIADLERFKGGKELYKRLGKAWKRGYLLYGPPGTGKSSLIAAMANYLNYDIYDLELTSVYSNTDLRSILLSTTNRSIIAIEDIDCSAEIPDRFGNDTSTTKLTLSGLLNFLDGLWSSCGDERIIVFTTNHKDRLDPALLRSGRMDMQIHMSYCTTQGFRCLASNYLGSSSNPHRLFSEIEGLIENVQATPAEIVGELMKSHNADIAFGEVVNFLKRKKIEAHDIKEDICSGAEKEAKRMKTEKIADKTISNCRNITTKVGSCRW